MSHFELSDAAFLDEMQFGFYACDSTGKITRYNRRAVELWGRAPVPGDPRDRFCGSFRLRMVDGAPMAKGDCPMADAVVSGASYLDLPVVMERPDGTSVTVNVNIRPLRDPHGRVLGAVNCFFDITAQVRSEALLKAQNRSLDQLASDASLEQILQPILLEVERQTNDGLLASILPLNAEGTAFERGIGPSMPEGFNEAVEGIDVDSLFGPCCRAVARRETVCVADFRSEPSLEAFNALVLPMGLRSGWSAPIIAPSGRVLGTFSNYYREARDPSPHDKELVALAMRTARLALQRRSTRHASRRPSASASS